MRAWRWPTWSRRCGLITPHGARAVMSSGLLSVQGLCDASRCMCVKSSGLFMEHARALWCFTEHVPQELRPVYWACAGWGDLAGGHLCLRCSTGPPPCALCRRCCGRWNLSAPPASARMKLGMNVWPFFSFSESGRNLPGAELLCYAHYTSFVFLFSIHIFLTFWDRF